jgi:hypothetical protein
MLNLKFTICLFEVVLKLSNIFAIIGGEVVVYV